eukprot:4472638-Prymnesium_polylepis.1
MGTVHTAAGTRVSSHAAAGRPRGSVARRARSTGRAGHFGLRRGPRRAGGVAAREARGGTACGRR